MTTIAMSDGRPKEPRKLRELATWYRAFAERAGNPVIGEARLRTAKELEREASRLEEKFVRQPEASPRIPGSNVGSTAKFPQKFFGSLEA